MTEGITTWCGVGEGLLVCMCLFVCFFIGRGGYPLFNAYLGVGIGELAMWGVAIYIS